MENPLLKTILYSIGGAIIGIVAGFLLSFLIAGLGTFANDNTGFSDVMEAASFLSMGFGAVIGAVSGSVASFRK